MRYVKLAAPAAVLLGGFLVCTSSIYGTPQYAQKEKKSCTTCHTKVSSDKAEMAKSLTDTGKCYQKNDHSLAKCESK